MDAGIGEQPRKGKGTRLRLYGHLEGSEEIGIRSKAARFCLQTIDKCYRMYMAVWGLGMDSIMMA